MSSPIKRYFISGLLIWLPIWVTILAIKFLVDILDSTLLLIPSHFRPDNLLGVHIPGFGVLITLVVILLTGVIVANFLGKHVITMWDNFIGRIPLVRTIHTGVKQILQTVFSPGGQSFRKVLLVEYPRAGVWTIAFQTGDAPIEVSGILNDEPMLSVYVPTTPNPTSGFFLMYPRKNVIELKMSVEQALKLVISLGVMQPEEVVKVFDKVD